jgi:hypothetical protein
MTKITGRSVKYRFNKSEAIELLTGYKDSPFFSEPVRVIMNGELIIVVDSEEPSE